MMHDREVLSARRTARVALVISLLSLLIGSGAVTWAAATIGSAQVIDNTLQSRDIKNGQVRSADIAVNAVGDRELAKVPAARATRSSSISIPSGVGITPIPFESETFDTSGLWSASQPTEMTVPRAGMYVVAGSALSGSSMVNDVMYIQVSVRTASGSTIGYDSDMVTGSAGSGSCTSVIKLAAGDKVRLVAFQFTGSAQDISVADLSVSWIGPAA